MPIRPPSHRPTGQKTAEQRRAQYDVERPTTTARGYDIAWRRFRKRIIEMRGPQCSQCGRVDRPNVDHLVSIRDDPARRLDASNVRVLCHSCHSARTSRDHSWNV